jgi:hypothetical protein
MTNSESETAKFLHSVTNRLSLASDVSTPSFRPKTGAILCYAAGCGARAVITDKDFLDEEQTASADCVQDALEILRRARSQFALLGDTSCDGYPWTKGDEECSAQTSFELWHTLSSTADIIAPLESSPPLGEIDHADSLRLLMAGLACEFYFQRHLKLDGQNPPKVAAGFFAHLEESLQTWAIVFGLDMEHFRSEVGELDEAALFDLMNKYERVSPAASIEPPELELADIHDYFVAEGLTFKMQSQFTLVHDSGMRLLGKPILIKAIKATADDSPMLLLRAVLFNAPAKGTPERAAVMEWILQEQRCIRDHVKIQLDETDGKTQCVVCSRNDWPDDLDEIPSLKGFVAFIGLLLDHSGELGLDEQAA